MADILLSQRFYPEKGGSISWLQEIFSHWPEAFTIITHDYPEFKSYPEIQLTNCKKLIRRNILMKDWGIKNLRSLKQYIQTCFILNQQLTQTELTIHCAHIIPEGLTAIITRAGRKNIKIIAYVHGEELLAHNSSRELRVLFQFAVRSINLYICNSQNTANLLRKMQPQIDPQRIKIINPCIAYDSYQKDFNKNALRKKYNLKTDARYLVSLGRLIKRKNQAAVILALNELRDKYPDLNYLCIGSGAEKVNLQKLAESLGLSERLSFMEPFNEADKIELLQIADLFVLPTIPTETDIEGFGIALVEAQACGLPVICGNSGGETEAVKAQESASVVDGSKLAEITAAIDRILGDSELYQQFSKAARSNARNYDSADSTNKIYALTKGLLNC